MTHILIVDDDKKSRSKLRALLQGQGYSVDEAINGKEALEKARLAPPDLVISDLLMPVMDGYTLLWQWKTDDELKSICFIVYTAVCPHEKDKCLALDLGADAYLVKSISTDSQSIIAKIKEILTTNTSKEITYPNGTLQSNAYNDVFVQKFKKQLTQLKLAHQEIKAELAACQQAKADHQCLIKRLSLAMRNADIGIWEWDPVNNKLTWDDQMYRLYGIQKEDFDGVYDNWKQCIVSEDAEQCEAMIKAALSGEEEFIAEFRVRWPDNSIHYISSAAKTFRDKTGQPLHMIGINYDITTHKNTEMALRSAKEEAEKISAELSSYLEAIGQLALVSVTDHTGRITQVNNKFCEISGYSQHELIGQNNSLLKSGIHPETFFAEMWRSITHGKIWHDEICNRNKLGKLYWVDATIVPLYDPMGKVSRYIAVKVDITERKEKEITLNERLKETNCLYAIRHDMLLPISLEEFFKRVLGHLIPAMQFSEIAVASIQFEDKLFTSERYREDLTHGLHTTIVVNSRICGQLQVFYTENKAFLMPEEANLITAITNDLQLWLERKQIEEVRKKSEALIWQQANFDSLTNLPNRHMFHNRLEQEIKKANRSKLSLALMSLDLDHFKQVNDTYGHGIGDILLIDAAKHLKSCVRETDFVARLGGDEFVIILSELDSPDIVDRIAQKILDRLKEPFYLKDKIAYISTSIGIALYPENGAEIGTLLSNTDQAMYASKNQGRNCFTYFTASMQQSAQTKWRLVDDLRNALPHNQLQLYYQPIVELATEVIYKAEALVRWHHPARGLVSPAEFIPIAEDTGMIMSIGDWIFHQAIDQVKKWRSSYHATFQIGINVSPIQFQNHNLNYWFHSLDKQGLPGKSIVIEITEGLLLHSNTNVINQLLLLRDSGIQVAIDDFGTGYSALSYLKKFNIDYLKIDQSFIHNLTQDSDDMALSEAIIVMAHKLGLKVIAEGIETVQQRDLLRAAGCDYGQGYLFSRPLPPEEFGELLK